jgi:uncharacterized repeat protein (TIGR03803 family)
LWSVFIVNASTMRAALAAALIAAACAQPALAATQTILYSFTAATDGGFPQGGVIADASGNLYGTTTSDGAGHNGVVYELTPGTGGAAAKQTTLYAFTGGKDGGVPQAGLVGDAKGNLYGTTYTGGAGGQGTVFELSPPKKAGGAWTEKTLWSFTGGNDGGSPSCALILDSAGNLYGTTEEGGTGVVGTVFELSPPKSGTKWTETVLYNFTGNNDGGEPYGRMLLASDGNLYGTTAGYGQYNYGTIFKLTAPAAGGSGWNFAVLHAFAGGTDGEVPRDGLIQGPDGTLYGDTAGFDTSYGNVFSLHTDGSAYTVLWTVAGGQGFTGNGPWQTVSMDASGNLYGATLADGRTKYGEVFKLTPPAAGKKAWRATVLHVYNGNAKGQIAYTTVLVGADGLYGTTYGFAGQSGFYPGTVWRITP